jgi:hypothetical protein
MHLDYDRWSPRWRDDPCPMHRQPRDQAPVRFSPATRTAPGTVFRARNLIALDGALRAGILSDEAGLAR